jgi:hypothetical protein
VPDFETHRHHGERWASFIAVLILLPVYLSTDSLVATATFGIISFLCVLGGATLPDIDSHSSIPRRSLERFVTTLLLASSTVMFALTWTKIERGVQRLTQVTASEVPIVELTILVGFLGGVALFRRVPAFVHKLIPQHRGLLHDIATRLLVSLSLAEISFIVTKKLMVKQHLSILTSSIVAGFLLAGVVLHLWLDGELSIRRRILSKQKE